MLRSARVPNTLRALLLLGAAWSVAPSMIASTSGREPGDTGTARWAAVNEPHQIRFEIDASGVRVAPLAPGVPRWTWELRLAGRGTPGDVRGEGEGWPGAAGGRFEILHGGLDEWFASRDEGLVHGLVIGDSEAPGLFEIDFAIGGSVTPKLAAGGREILFHGRRGAEALRLRGLTATDAEGRDVAARWEIAEAGSVLRLILDGSDHLYPIEVRTVVATTKGLAKGPRRGRQEAAPSGPAAGSSLDAGVLAVPSNDECTGAEVIPGDGPFPYLSGTHDVTDATTAGDPPEPSCQSVLSRSVWFKFTPSVTAPYTISLCSAAPSATTLEDTVLAVYSSSGSCNGLNEVAGGCDDDSCAVSDLQSVISALDLGAGVTYYIVAWQYGAAPPPPGGGDVQLRIVKESPPPAAPANDTCGSAEVIPPAGPFPYLTAVTADVTGARTTGDPPLPSCQTNVSRSVWYAFTPAASGRYSFSLCSDAPTGTSLDDTVIAIYTGSRSCGGYSQVTGACDDDSCVYETGQSVIPDVFLTGGVTYYAVVWKYDTPPPAGGNVSVQLRVSQVAPPGNDTCGAAPALGLDAPVSGTTAYANDDYRAPATAGCYTGLAQSPSPAPGGDAVYSFTAPAAGEYSFRVTGLPPTRNGVLYAASDCPSAPPPAQVAGCLGAANRNAGYPGEEVRCLPLASGQRVYLYVDEAALTSGTSFTLEANACALESEPNDDPLSAGELLCGIEGSVAPGADADFYLVGSPPPGSRLFAMVDGAASSSTDYDLRVTTGTETLEYDDLDNDIAFGSVAPNVAGTPLPGGAAYLRVSHYSAAAIAEPYRLYAKLQPAPAAATPEAEPNGTIAQATAGANLYFSGSLSSDADVDVYAFSASAGDLVFAGLDPDPARDATPFNGSLALLDAGAATLLRVDDNGSASSPAAGSGLDATSPYSPGEALTYRIRASGTYYIRVAWSGGAPGDYLLSIAVGCGLLGDSDGDGVADPQDCAPADPGVWSPPGPATGLRFTGASTLEWDPPAVPGGLAVSYDLLRAAAPAGFAAPVCVVKGSAATSAPDAAAPAGIFDYLVRTRNACGESAGASSNGTPRPAGACP